MKKISIIFFVLSMFVTMTQCKKNLQVIPETDAVFINVDVCDNSKVAVNTLDGKVSFQEGDVLYVASNGRYVGCLTYNGSHFAGTITGAVVDQLLYFYFLGNQNPGYLEKGKTTSLSVVIDDQSEMLPIISYGPSKQVYVGEGSYSAFLFNQCALVKFDVKTTSEKSVCLVGMNNRVTVNLENNNFKNDKEGEGIIKLAAGSGEKWAILLPQGDVRAGEMGSLFTDDDVYTGVRPAISALEANAFVEDAIELNVFNTYVNGGSFSSSRAKKVTFSPGNLQYVNDGSKCMWKFADNQYDVIGMGQNGNSSDEKISRDLYGWGTGDNPCNLSTSDSDYSTFVDWGVGMNSKDGVTWRTLSESEWDYILFRRKASTIGTTENARYTKAVVNGVNGMILFPDVYTHPGALAIPNDINYTTDNQKWGVNTYTVEQWQLMQDAGAIFLPAAGIRNGTAVDKVGTYGRYWSSYSDGDALAYDLMFSDYRPYPSDAMHRHEGFAVRLVHE
ncbi:MAG: hypothetical protein J6T53_07470 [Bacteroidales bacterium]|nr:hypothetical protein [Bacteroidales bacterium]